MNTEDAKKIAEAIVLCVATAYGKGKTVGELKQKCVEILTADPAAPVEKEYRAGEWVPTFGVDYWYYDAGAAVDWDIWQGDTIERRCRYSAEHFQSCLRANYPHSMSPPQKYLPSAARKTC